MSTKAAIITGGGIGIGRSSAFAFRGRLSRTDILEGGGRRVVAELQAKGADAEFHALDVRDTQQTKRVVAAVAAKHGGSRSGSVAAARVRTTIDCRKSETELNLPHERSRLLQQNRGPAAALSTEEKAREIFYLDFLA
jgi:NAD(P)-dependent dehydrogenase (short-subunit alcohol dehydrogenase family)